MTLIHFGTAICPSSGCLSTHTATEKSSTSVLSQIRGESHLYLLPGRYSFRNCHLYLSSPQQVPPSAKVLERQQCLGPKGTKSLSSKTSRNGPTLQKHNTNSSNFSPSHSHHPASSIDPSRSDLFPFLSSSSHHSHHSHHYHHPKSSTNLPP